STALAPTNAVTVEAWALTDTNKIQFIAGNGNTGYQGYWLGTTGGYYTFSVGLGGTTYRQLAGAPIEIGIWKHLVGTFDGTTVKIYIDGVLKNSYVMPGTINYSGIGNFTVGQIYDLYSGRYWSGKIDDVAIYNRALTDAEILEHYQAGLVSQPTVSSVPSTSTSQTITLSGTKQANTSIVINGAEVVPLDSSTSWQTTYTLQSGSNTLNVTAKNAGGYSSDPVVVNVTYQAPTPPIAIWHMDGNWNDSSGNGNNGTAYNGATFSTSSKIGTHAGSFDGVNDYVALNNIANFTTEITVEAWVKAVGDPSTSQPSYNGEMVMVGQGNGFLLGYTYIPDSSGALGWYVRIGNTWKAVYTTAAYNRSWLYNAGWTHFVGTYDGSKLKIYINGVLNNETLQTGAITIQSNSSDGLQISGRKEGGAPQDFFNGLIDEVSIYNRALSADEIKAHYDAVSVTQPTVNSVPETTTSQAITLSGTKQANTSILVNGTEIVPFDSSTTWQVTYTLQGGANTLSVIARNSGGYNSDPVVVNVTYLTPPIAIWHMDNNWQDSSGNGYNGTAYNGATFGTNSRVGTHAGSFDGVDDYVQIPGTSFFNLSSDFTISFWLKRDASESGNFRVLMGKVSNAGSDGWYIRKGTAAQGNPIYLEMGNSSYQYRAYGSSSSTPAGSWLYYVFTRQGANWKVYLDGSLQGSGSNFESPHVNSYDLYIGRLGTCAAYNWYGLVDEVAVYNRALSASEILEHYQLVYIAPPTVNPVTSPTATQTITLSGTKPTNTSIIVNGTQVYQLDALTTWQGTYTLQSGTNTLNITDMDDKANLSQPVMITVVYDNLPPTISSSTPSNNASVNTSITSVTINLADSYSSIDLTSTTTVASVKNSLGQDIPGAWTTSGNSTVIFAPSNFLSEGTYTVTIYPTDSLGNRTTAQISFTYDATAPPAPGINTVVTPTNIASQVLSGTKSSDTASIVITTSPASTVGAVSYPTGTTWSVPVSSLKEGTNTITVYAKDPAGNQSDGASAIITYDSIPPAAPTVNVTSPTKDTIITLTGTKESNASIWINNTKKVEIDSSTTWQSTYTLQFGSNALNITSKDTAGNQSGTTTVTVILDDKPPVIESSVPANNFDTAKIVSSVTINLTDIYSTVELTGSTIGATVKNSSGQLISGTWTTSGTKAIIFTPSNLLPQDTYTVTIYPVDALGNKGTGQIIFKNYDVTKPVTTISLSGTKDSAGWYSTPVTVTMSADDGADGSGIEKIEYSFDMTNWNTYASPFVMDNDGTNVLYYRATDKAGNIEKASVVAGTNAALSSNGGVASATSRLNDKYSHCDGSPYFANDGQAVQPSGGCGDGLTWLGAYASGDTWMVKFSSPKYIGEMRWMAWTSGGWTDPYSHPKDYYVEYTTDSSPVINGGNWQPVTNMVVTNTNGTVNQAAAFVSGNTNGNWLFDPSHKWIIHNFYSINATALRIRVTAKVSGSAYGPALGEVEVYETETTKSQTIKINKTGIVGWWKMDNNWQDSSVMGNHGTASGAVFSTNAKIGTYAGSFDGSNDYVTAPLFYNFSAVSVEFWIKTSSTAWTTSLNGISSYNFYISRFTSNSGKIIAIFDGSSGNNNASQESAISVADGNWHHIAGTNDGTTTRLYVDGVLDKTYAEILYAINTVAYFSYPAGGSSYSNGLLDEVIVYNRALSGAEIKGHYDAAQVQPPTVNPVTSPTGSQSIALSGTKPANTSVRVNGAEILPLDASTTWQGTYTLQSGSNTLNITAMDAGGYQSSAVTLSVTLDNIAPIISGSTPSNNTSLNTPIASITINLTDTYSTSDLTATTTGATVKDSSGQEIPGAWTTSGTSSVIFTPSNQLSQDTYTVTVYPTDSLGNKTTAQITFNYDATAPPAPAFNAVVSPTNIAAQVISGTKSSDTAAITLVTSPVLT
ncbi:MAG: hypothetical protein EPN94_12110, partial [Nitrospirae bacterium]